MIKLSGSAIANGVVTGLIVTAIAGLCIAAYRSWQESRT